MGTNKIKNRKTLQVNIPSNVIIVTSKETLGVIFIIKHNTNCCNIINKLLLSIKNIQKHRNRNGLYSYIVKKKKRIHKKNRFIPSCHLLINISFLELHLLLHDSHDCSRTIKINQKKKSL